MNLVKAQEYAQSLPLAELKKYADGLNPSMIPPWLATGEMQAKTKRAEMANNLQGAAQGELTDGLRNLLGVIPWAWAEDNTTTDEDRGALVTVTCATGSLLLVDFAVATGNLATSFGTGGAGAAVGAIGDHEIVDGLATFLSTHQNKVGCLSVFCGESLCGHDWES